MVKSAEKPQIRIEQRNQAPIILINDRYLLTVTQQDIDSGLTPQEQANIWAENINQVVQQARQERSKSYIILRLLLVAVISMATLTFHWFLGKIWRRSAPFWRPVLQVEENAVESPEIQGLNLILSLTLLLARIILWVVIFLYITNLFPLTRLWSYRLSDRLIDSFTSPLLSIGKNSYSVMDFLILISLLITLFVLGNTIANLLRLRVLRLTQIERGIQEAIAIFAKYTFIFIGSIVVLQVWGFDLSSLTILASAFELLVWIREPKLQPIIKSELYLATNLRRDSLVEGGVRKEESGVRRVSMFLDFARITGQ